MWIKLLSPNLLLITLHWKVKIWGFEIAQNSRCINSLNLRSDYKCNTQRTHSVTSLLGNIRISVLCILRNVWEWHVLFPISMHLLNSSWKLSRRIWAGVHNSGWYFIFVLSIGNRRPCVIMITNWVHISHRIQWPISFDASHLNESCFSNSFNGYDHCPT